MAPDRFDDVEVRFLDDPEPEPARTPPSLRRRMTVALSATILGAGVLAAGASAVAGEDAAAGGAAKAGKAKLNAQGVPFQKDGRECRGGHRGGSESSSRLSPSDL